jgi:hypothetical protein
MTEARGRWAFGLLVIDRGGALGAPQCHRLGGDQLVAENEDVVLFSSSHHSASMGRRGVDQFRYPHSRKADSPTERGSRQVKAHLTSVNNMPSRELQQLQAGLSADPLEKDDSSDCIQSVCLHD